MQVPIESAGAASGGPRVSFEYYLSAMAGVESCLKGRKQIIGCHTRERERDIERHRDHRALEPCLFCVCDVSMFMH